VRRPGAIRARASLATELHLPAQGAGRTRVSTLRSEAPLILRPALPKAREPWAAHAHDVARVSLAAGAGGPVGGDELHLQVRVGAGSSLVLAEISPTLALPGPHGGQSRLRVDVEVAAGGTLIWLPEPVIAARGCDHLTDVRVELDEQARLFLREELLLGRHGERAAGSSNGSVSVAVVCRSIARTSSWGPRRQALRRLPATIGPSDPP
jgi:urease accessory protein